MKAMSAMSHVPIGGGARDLRDLDVPLPGVEGVGEGELQLGGVARGAPDVEVHWIIQSFL